METKRVILGLDPGISYKGIFMKKIIISFTTILLALLFISCGKKPLTDDYGCFVDYDEAITYAGKKNQPILIFFTSQGDDDQSTLLVTDVLKNASFKEKILLRYQ